MYFTKYDMTDTFAHNTHGTGGRPFNTSGIWELPPTYIQRLIKYTVCFLACRADENARTSCTRTRKALRCKEVERAERAERSNLNACGRAERAEQLVVCMLAL